MVELKRVEAMKAWLDEHAAEVNAWQFGQVRFDWGQGDVKAFIGRSELVHRKMQPGAEGIRDE